MFYFNFDGYGGERTVHASLYFGRGSQKSGQGKTRVRVGYSAKQFYLRQSIDQKRLRALTLFGGGNRIGRIPSILQKLVLKLVLAVVKRVEWRLPASQRDPAHCPCL